jgi:hypothetical protein
VTGRRAFRVLLAVALLCLAWAGVQLARAGLAGRRGAAALERAESALGRRDTARADRDLSDASSAFAAMRSHARHLGPAGPVLRVTPFVRVQVGSLGSFAAAGTHLADGAREVTTAVARVSGGTKTEPLDVVRDMTGAVDRARTALDAAADATDGLRTERLVWPLSSRQHELLRRLPVVRQRVDSFREGLAAIEVFAGGSGPRRYLVFSQNPDEVRPTGGFIGTYGVLTAVDGSLRLDRYDAIEDWYRAHPQAALPVAQSASALQFAVPQSRQNISNVNTTPDWPAAATLARTLWRRGGEQPVDGVLSVTPDFLARVLGVLGPVHLPSYPDTVTRDNVVALADKYTHQETGPQPGGRKGFIAELARVALRGLVDAPRDTWPDLAEVAGRGLGTRELLAWSADPAVQQALVAHDWAGRLPATEGDFLTAGEFEYAAKNGRLLRRVVDHVVEIHPDGSARVTTTLSIANTAPPSHFNVDSQSYVVLYGPAGATLAAGSDRPDAREPALAGHPAAGWLRAAEPGRRTTIRAVWDVPRLVSTEKVRQYVLQVRPTPAHTGDVLKLRVVLPAGWRWDGSNPDGEYALDAVLSRMWAIRTP